MTHLPGITVSFREGVTFCDLHPCASLLFSWSQGRQEQEALAVKLQARGKPNLTSERSAKNSGPRDYGGFRHM